MINYRFPWNALSVAEGLEVINQCRPDLLVNLKAILDSYHGQSRPVAYYDVLAGDWLEHFVHLTYAAWQEVLLGNVPTGRQPIPVSADLAEHAQLRWQESGLHGHLRWAIARLLEGASPDDWDFERQSVIITSGGHERLPQRLLRSFATVRPGVLVTAPYFKCSRAEWAGTLWRWRRWLAWDDLRYPVYVSAKLDTAWRRAQAVAAGPVASLHDLLRVLMPLHLPVALLEGFADYRNTLMALPLIRPKVIYSANALHNHLTFKLLAAEWRQQGTLLLYHQHGGGYGIDRIHTLEKFEIRVSDRYYTWGWRGEAQNVRPLSLPSPRPLHRSRKRLLLCCVDFPRVVYRLHFQPMPGSTQVMHRETCEFLTTLSDRKNLLVRPYFYDYGWDFLNMMRTAAPGATFDDHRESSFVRYAESRLVIHNYLGTGWLETLALNIPTVCFFDPEVYAFRSEAQPYTDALERVGILHRSGKLAARFVSGLVDDPEGWWTKSEVQEARRNFIEHYANFSPNWKAQWEGEFEDVLSNGLYAG